MVPPPKKNGGEQDQPSNAPGAEDDSLSGSSPEGSYPEDSKDDLEKYPPGAPAAQVRVPASEEAQKAAETATEEAKKAADAQREAALRQQLAEEARQKAGHAKAKGTEGTAPTDPDQEARILREKIAKLKEINTQQELSALKEELRALRAKTGRSVDEEIAIKARTDAESLPDKLEVNRGRENQITWLTQVFAMLPKKLRQAIDEAISKSKIQPIWGNLGATDLTLWQWGDCKNMKSPNGAVHKAVSASTYKHGQLPCHASGPWGTPRGMWPGAAFGASLQLSPIAEPCS